MVSRAQPRPAPALTTSDIRVGATFPGTAGPSLVTSWC